MKFVEIYKLQNDGSQKIIAVCKLAEDGGVECDGEKTFVDNLKQEGIRDYSKSAGEKLFPKDGLRFLEELRFNFRSGYLNASEVKEE